MKTRILLFGLALMLAAHGAWAQSLAGKGTLELFMNHKRVVISLPQDAKLYELFGNFVSSCTILQHLDGATASSELQKANHSKNRLVFTATQPFSHTGRYGQTVMCKKIYVTLPENHIPQVLLQEPTKYSDLSNYSRKALNALVSYPKINMGNLNQYQPEKKKPQPSVET